MISGSRHALEPKYGVRKKELVENGRARQRTESNIILQPILECALDSFIRGLFTEISKFVNTRHPRDMDEALEYAVHAEEREDYME